MRSLSVLIAVVVLTHSLWINEVNSLKCRKDNSAQEAQFKRVIRSCMRKMADNGNRRGDMFSTSDNRNDDYQGNNNNNNNNNRYKFSRNFNNSDNNNRNRYNQRYNYYTPGEDRYQDRNKYSNSDDFGLKYGNNKNMQNNNNNKYNNQQQQQQQQQHTDYDRYGAYADDDDVVGKYGEQRRNQNQFKIMMSNVQGDQSTDSPCVVHCFFNELNMLNDQGFPDRNQVNYILLQGTQNRELRSFYTDTVHKCFHYVDSKQHRDRCDYARDIAQCLMEYAKANCEDIQTHNIIFN